MANDLLYKHILNGIHDGVYFVDKDRKITFWNKAAEDITGFKSVDILNCYCHDNILNHVDDNGNELCLTGCPLQKSLEDGTIRTNKVYLHHKDGHRVPVTVHIVPIYEGDDIIGAVESFTDDSERIAFLDTLGELKAIAYKDQLTELPNRRYLETFIENKINSYKELGIPFAVAMFDIDHFKSFNDTYGHDVGDQVLKMVSKIFTALTRKDDVIGRWGGEEFLGVFVDVSLVQLEQILERIRVLIEKSALRHDKDHLKVTISVGGTLIESEDTMDTLIKRADVLLYTSKENGRNKTTTE